MRRSEPFVLSMWQALAAAESPEAGRAALLEMMTPEAKAMLGVPAETDPAVLQLISGWIRERFVDR